MKALSSRNDDPAHASRPWDRDRDGFVIAEGAGIVVLEERVVEETALVVGPAKPVVEHLEDDEQSFARGLCTAARFRDDPPIDPKLLAEIEDRHREAVLGSEMAVQGHLGDASLGHDPIDTDRLHPVPAEEVVRRAEYAPARVVVRLLDLIGLRRPGRGRVTFGTVR